MTDPVHQRPHRLIAALWTVLAIVAAACSGAEAPTEASGDGFFRLGTLTAFDSLNPFNLTDLKLVRENLYPTLVTLGEDEYIPYLAERWDVSEDGTTWTFHLAEDAVWSDGEPVTAEDVVFTYDLIRAYGESGETARWAGGAFEEIAGWEAPDDHTVILTYEEFVPNSLTGLDDRYILPAHIWGDLLDAGGEAITTFGDQLPVVGAGPFRLVDFRPGESALLERNPEFWGEVPHLERLGVRGMATADSAIAALRSGEIDGIDRIEPTPALAAIAEDPTLVVQEAPSPSGYYLGFNLNPEKGSAPVLLKPDVRRAMRHAIDRERVATIAFDGHAVPWAEYHFNEPFANPDIPVDEHDPQMAAELLDAQGYAPGSDGVRSADGERMSFELLRPATAIHQRVAEAVIADLAEVGIEIRDAPTDEEVLYDEIVAPDGEYLDMELFMWNWEPQDPDPDVQVRAFTTDELYGFNESGYSDAEYDALAESIAAEPAPELRRELVQEASALVHRDALLVPLVKDNLIAVHSTAYEGMEMTSNGMFLVWQLPHIRPAG